MNATLSGIDTILIMPTGGGKSLCFQLPALISKGITLVVSPLVSLMEDQLMSLKARGVQARMLSAASTREEVNGVHSDMTNPNSQLKLLYVTPEKLAKSKRFMAKLQKMHQIGRFARLAIDEVHCCSQWGHDFRPDYKYLGIMHKMFPGTPILGLTATATSRVIQDVQKILDIKGCLVLKASFNRPNLFYEVRPKPPVQEECATQLQQLLEGEFKNESGIIYTMTIKDAEELVSGLKSRGLRVAPYHAQLDAQVRSKIHRKWVENEYQAVVATIAFGMGIDKPDVRFVIHHCISKSMENFYQESGRAGRDGRPAKCIIFWRFADLSRQSTMVFTEQTGQENLYGLISYCLDSHRCRRNIIAEHFDERWETADCRGMCDHCKAPRETKNLDTTKYGEHLLMILTKAASLDQKLTGQKLVDLFLGKGSPKLRVQEAIATGLARDRAENIVAFFLIDGFLKEDFHFTPYSTISYIVPGPKAEAGVPPSALIVGGIRKLSSISVSQSSEKAADNSQRNHAPKTEEQAGTTKKREIKSKANLSFGNNSDCDASSRTSSISDSKKNSSNNCKDQTQKSKFSQSKKSARNCVKSQVKSEQKSNTKGVAKSPETATFLLESSSDAEHSYSDASDQPSSYKRRRIITIDNSSDCSEG
nr:ATP-dependent DNA helicase Q1-like isoform X2 [Procambarus clarkii]